MTLLSIPSQNLSVQENALPKGKKRKSFINLIKENLIKPFLKKKKTMIQNKPELQRENSQISLAIIVAKKATLLDFAK